jgi:hypothetical protein
VCMCVSACVCVHMSVCMCHGRPFTGLTSVMEGLETKHNGEICQQPREVGARASKAHEHGVISWRVREGVLV